MSTASISRVWFIDNVAVLMTLIRGRSESPDLEVMSGIIHALLFAYKTWIFWEWVPSKSKGLILSADWGATTLGIDPMVSHHN